MAGGADAAALRLPDPVVTGEGVQLELRPASVLTRGLAWALDVLVLAAVAAALLVVLLRWVLDQVGSGLDTAALSALWSLGVVGLLVGLPTAWEALTRGRSPGKAVMGLRVVRDDGGPVRVRHAVLRALVGVLELWGTTGSVAVITSMVHPRGKRVGDLIAGTYVVRERAGAARTAPLVEPHHLRAWAASADIGRLPDALASTARQVLGRAPGLHPAARERLLAELAAQVGRRVAPPPPAGTTPADLLAAVLVERRAREEVRLRAARERRDVLAERSRRLQGL